MANRNIRVYELAKELNKTSREIISLLAEKNIEVTTHMATLEDNQADQVRAQVNQESAKAAEGAAQDAKPKKKKFIVVHNPENSRDRKSPERRPAQPKTQAGKPSRKSSPEISTFTFSSILLSSAYFFNVRVNARRKPARCVPPSMVLILLTYE